MRSRYVAVAGPAEAVRRVRNSERLANRLSPTLKPRVDLPGLLLFANEEAPIVTIGDSSGIVVGRLFETRSGDRIEALAGPLAAQAVATFGRALLERCWGSYAAFLTSRSGHVVVRDPSGAVPVYRARHQGTQIYFSDAGAAVAPGLVGRDLDPAFAAHWLSYPYLRSERTGLAAVRELLPGTRHVSDQGGSSIEQAWSPWSFALAERLTSFDEAAEQLREAVLRTTSRLAGRRPILLELSGGLDSAILAAALHRAGIPFCSANFATRAPDGDERSYARKAARAAGSPLSEILEGDFPVDLSTPSERLMRPGLSPMVMPLHRAFGAHASSLQARSFLTGTGGDNVFCFLTTAAPILDSARELGWHRALAGTAPDVARLNGCTVWTALRYAAAKWAGAKGRRRWKREDDFLAPGISPPLDRHPWLDAPADGLPGSLEHVEALLRIQHFLDPENRASEVEFVHPLMAQPVMELCLRIPSWMWIRGGRNRAVARHAFRDLIPMEIVKRSGKGRLENMCARTFMRSRREVAALLLDGSLAAEGILDRSAVEDYLKQDGEPRDVRYFRIFELAATELWIRSWRR